MSETVFNIILKVDLQCCKCKKKIKKTLCKLQCRNEKIRKVAYDDEKNTVTITGPFDPQKLIKKICCMARKVILDIKIDKVPPPPPPPPPPSPPPPPPPPKCCCCRPCYVVFYGCCSCGYWCCSCRCCSCGCRCCSCGCAYGPGCNGPCYDDGPPTCAIM